MICLVHESYRCDVTHSFEPQEPTMEDPALKIGRDWWSTIVHESHMCDVSHSFEPQDPTLEDTALKIGHDRWFAIVYDPKSGLRKYCQVGRYVWACVGAGGGK